MKYKATVETLEHGLSEEIDKTYIYSSPFSGIFFSRISSCQIQIQLEDYCHFFN
ncbi:hypothetical protein ACJIZ3_013340 [Penstemon smallii]|uniref:Uncharacterized protein n=1 Tax=Penstemon smallii TaxID=265156 RepID=A0ABD3USV2_9LAMI